MGGMTPPVSIPEGRPLATDVGAAGQLLWKASDSLFSQASARSLQQHQAEAAAEVVGWGGTGPGGSIIMITNSVNNDVLLADSRGAASLRPGDIFASSMEVSHAPAIGGESGLSGPKANSSVGLGSYLGALSFKHAATTDRQHLKDSLFSVGQVSQQFRSGWLLM